MAAGSLRYSSMPSGWPSGWTTQKQYFRTPSSTLPRRHLIRQTVPIVIACLLLFSFRQMLLDRSVRYLYADSLSNLIHTKPFRWEQIDPSEELKYHDCYDGLKCARLEVPMDHSRMDGSGQKVALALVRRPAKVPVSDPRYGGVVLINPGGPGGSGVALQLAVGASLQVIMDSDVPASESTHDASQKYFDILGFDPRGVNNSTPALSCFPNSVSRQTWNLQAEAEGMLGSAEDSLRKSWRRSRALADGCSRALAMAIDEDALGEHVNTSPVVADIVAIIERHGQWRGLQAEEAQDLQDKRYGHDPSRTIAKRTKWNKGHEKLLYWGFSYGTVIGATFAAMHPEKISRMILDGVVDSEDYYNGPWLSNIGDTDKIFDRFTTYCSEAGPKRCRFHRQGGPHAIQAAYEKLLMDIVHDPLSVPATASRGPEIITWTDIKVLTKTALYQPLQYFPVLSDLLSDIVTGNGSQFADFKQGQRTWTCPSASCELDGPYSPACASDGWDGIAASSAILCTDAQGLRNVDEDEFRAYWELLKGQSEALGDYWAQVRLGCVGWRAEAKWRFTGPFSGETSHPILWIGNTLDTVTPLRNAKKMSLSFPGSVVLQQDSEGHCSIAAPSLCTAKSVRKYFQAGVLPEPGTICTADMRPFDTRAAERLGILNEEDRRLLDAIEHIGAKSRVGRLGVEWV